jgi:predicted transport protein
MAKIFTPERISLQNHPEITEKIIQEIIADDPKILDLGDLILKDKERRQPRSGRLDLLMQDSETDRRYEIEIQLGKTDESHIMRTIEYWDIEKKRYPHYEHCAVIIAENITSRFLNIISLFHGSIPLIAIQISAYKFRDEVGLIFTKVLDEMSLGSVEEEEGILETTNREYWLKRATEKTVKMADELLDLINGFKAGFSLKYNKFYIGLAKDGQPNNFVIFRPKKSFLRLELKLPKTQEVDEIIEKNEFDEMDYLTKWSRYRIRINPGDINKNKTILNDLLMQSESYFNS